MVCTNEISKLDFSFEAGATTDNAEADLPDPIEEPRTRLNHHHFCIA